MYVYQIGTMPNFKFKFCNSLQLSHYIILIEVNGFQHLKCVYPCYSKHTLSTLNVNATSAIEMNYSQEYIHIGTDRMGSKTCNLCICLHLTDINTPGLSILTATPCLDIRSKYFKTLYI